MDDERLRVDEIKCDIILHEIQSVVPRNEIKSEVVNDTWTTY